MLDELKLLLGIAGNEEDALLSLLLKEAGQMARDYCNIIEIPPEMETTVARMAAQMYKNGAGGTGSVESITEGDVSIRYGNGESGDILPDFRTQMDSYRRIKW